MAQASAAFGHTLAVDQTGQAWSWGANDEGQLGDGTTTSRDTPGTIPAWSRTLQLDGGYEFSLGLKSGGSVWAWGGGSSGQLGHGDLDQSERPVQVSGVTGAVAIAAGKYHGLALLQDGTVMAWGSNVYFQLGTSEPGPSGEEAILVPNLTNVVALAAGEKHSLALLSDGTVMGWGTRDCYVLGQSDSGGVSPRPVVGLADVIDIAAGDTHSMALLNDGTVLTWGCNDYGQIGDGTYDVVTDPQPVPNVADVVDIAAGAFHSLAVTSDGRILAWGANSEGQLGRGVTSDGMVWPGEVQQLDNATATDGGDRHSIAVLDDGSMRAWGANYPGRLGDGTTASSSVPVEVAWP